MESAAAAVSQPGVPAWANLPTDLLLDISGRLHDACDFVRFHSICQPWRDAALSLPATAASLRKFRPWLISLQNGRIMCRISSDVTFTRGRRSYSGKVLEGSPFSGKSWVAGADGEAISLFTGGPQPTLHDFVTGAVTHLTAPLNDNYGIQQQMRKLRGVVYGDGTIFLYSFVSEPAPGQILNNTFFTAAILRPGDMAWTAVEKSLDWRPNDNNRAAYHDGKVIVWVNTYRCCVVIPGFAANGGDDRLETNNGTCLRTYVLESRGELLWVSLLVMHDRVDKYNSVVNNALGVKVYALEEQADSGSAKMRWVERDGRSFGDRVLFLGLPMSFAAKATELDMEGGCAYLFFRNRLFKCNLSDGGAKLIEGPFFGCDLKDECLWLRPQPIWLLQSQKSEKEFRSVTSRKIFNLVN